MDAKNATEIKIFLLLRKISQAQIARDIGVHKVVVNQVIHGKCTSKRVEDYINKLMGKAA